VNLQHQALQLIRQGIQAIEILHQVHLLHLQAQIDLVHLQHLLHQQAQIDLEAVAEEAAVVAAAEAVAAVGVVLKWFIMEYGKKLNNSLV
jgi:translation initiation factor 2 gamma subunit (eIF-2gamma)